MRVLAVVAVLLALVLTGCSSAPSKKEARERYTSISAMIEPGLADLSQWYGSLTDAQPTEAQLTEFSRLMAVLHEDGERYVEDVGLGPWPDDVQDEADAAAAAMQEDLDDYAAAVEAGGTEAVLEVRRVFTESAFPESHHRMRVALGLASGTLDGS